ncbi:hypothetical protein Y047_6109 [Burkholderia pseudomallei MSHR3016]|nr:hypothetical protein Y047_6109 [Burkholderia pseudomallei MSHR3016]
MSSSVTDCSAASSDARWPASSGAFMRCLLTRFGIAKTIGASASCGRVGRPEYWRVSFDGSTGKNPPLHVPKSRCATRKCEESMRYRL